MNFALFLAFALSALLSASVIPDPVATRVNTYVPTVAVTVERLSV
jgi:hypothetical protein